MNSFIEYFYNIQTDKIIYNKKYYSFTYHGYIYKLYVLDEKVNINFLIEIEKKLLGHTLISEIIFNRNNQIITNYNGN